MNHEFSRSLLRRDKAEIWFTRVLTDIEWDAQPRMYASMLPPALVFLQRRIR